MKLYKQLSILSLCTLMLVCCKDDHHEPSQMAGKLLSFFAVTDADGTTGLYQGDPVGLTLWDEQSGHTYHTNLKLVAADNGDLIGEEQLLYPEGATSLSAFAYMPYRTDWTNNVNYRRVEVYSDQSLYENFHASDFLIGKPENGNPLTSTSVKLRFKHVMSRINIELTDPTETVGISEAAIRITNVLTAAFVNPYSGEVSTIEGQTGSVLTYRTLGTAQSRSDRRETLSAIIPAQTLNAGTSFIEIRINAKKYNFIVPDEITLNQGNEYNYSLELTGDAITLVSSTVTNWNQGGTVDTYLDQGEGVTPDARQQGYDIYLCLGESNMAGRATISASMYEAMEGVWLLNDQDSLEVAKNPLNRYSSIREELSLQRLSPAWSFARTMYSHTGRKVALVVNARGNTPIRQWQKGASQGYYEEAVRRAKQAMRFGVLHGILWQQGCSDVSEGDADQYQQQLLALLKALRTDLDASDLPVVVGQLPTWNWTANSAGTTPFNEKIAGIATLLDHAGYATSYQLSPWLDDTDSNYSTESQLTLGVRFAERMLQLEGYED